MFLFCRFKSNYFLNGLGFQMRYDSSNEDPETNYMFGFCDGYFTTSSGNISSPSYPNLYPNAARCSWKISQPIGTSILLTFLSIDIEYHSVCQYDYVLINDGYNKDSPFIGSRLCGTVPPSPIQSSQNNMWIRKDKKELIRAVQE